MNNKERIYQAYVLIDPITNIPRYVGTKFVYYDHDLFKKVYNNPMQHNINQSKANGKGVNQIKDGKIIATYTSFSEAAKSLGNYNWRYAIAECCKGKRKKWKGFEWKSAV